MGHNKTSSKADLRKKRKKTQPYATLYDVSEWTSIHPIDSLKTGFKISTSFNIISAGHWLVFISAPRKVHLCILLVMYIL